MPAIRDLLILDDLNLTYLRGRSKFKVGQPFRIAWNYGRWHRRADHSGRQRYQRRLDPAPPAIAAAAA